jgi:hypothetical protein
VPEDREGPEPDQGPGEDQVVVERLLKAEQAVGPMDLEAGCQQAEDQDRLRPVPEALEARE